MTIDIVTVYHRDENFELAQKLHGRLERFETHPFRFIGVDNREKNRGFAKGCNVGAAKGDAPFIGFLNPDVHVIGPFLERVRGVFKDDQVVITGESFGKTRREIEIWGCDEWVCGAAMFVRRDWFESRGGFDQQFVWGWEETDLIRQAQVSHKKVVQIRLPIRHDSPSDNPAEDVRYKNLWFNEGAKRYQRKWKHRR